MKKVSVLQTVNHLIAISQTFGDKNNSMLILKENG